MEQKKQVNVEETKKKKCFIITPIGDEGSDIRRHIDGVNNAAIRPALDKEYEIKVAHESYNTGSITKEVILDIYESDLVIANLTGLNPNVMYELAIRHAVRKPVIQIMEKGESLPFDITTERTLFYVNDFSGVLELKEKISNMVKNIEDKENSNPIYDALKENEIDKKIIEKAHIDTKDVNILEEILKKFDKIEKRLYIEKNKCTSYTDPRTNYVIKINFSNIDNSSKIGIKDFEKQLLNMKPVSISIEYCHINGSEMILQIRGYKYELQKYIDDLKFILVDKYEGVKLNIEEYQSNNP